MTDQIANLINELKTDVAPVDENIIKGFAQNAHKLGLNNKQAQGILEFYKSTLEGSAKEMAVNMESAQAEATNALRAEWGRAYDDNVYYVIQGYSDELNLCEHLLVVHD